MDAGLQSAAEEVAKSGIGPAAREAVRRLCREHPEATDCAVVDDKGTMQVVEPSDYSIFEGVFIGQQEQVLRLQNTKQPVLSRVFRSVEGTDAVDFERPVLTPEGKFAGSVSILFRPEFLLLTTIAGAVETSDAEVWAVQKDGTALYDTEKGAARKAIFDALGPRIAEEETGSALLGVVERDVLHPLQGRAGPAQGGALDERLPLRDGLAAPRDPDDGGGGEVRVSTCRRARRG